LKERAYKRELIREREREGFIREGYLLERGSIRHRGGVLDIGGGY
jgi:hypothetical protein